MSPWITGSAGIPTVITLVLAFAPRGPSGPAAWGGLLAMWAAAGAALYLAGLPRRLLVGLNRPRLTDVAIGLGTGLVLMLAVPVLHLLGSRVLPPEQATAGTARGFALVLAGVVTAAVTEEVLFRGVGLTALMRAGVPTWAAATLSLLLFVSAHIAGWQTMHLVFVVVPFGLALTLLYLWRHSLWLVIRAHLVVDLPLVVLAW